MKILIPGAGGKVQHIRSFQAVPEVESVVITEIYPWAYGNFAANRAYRTPPFADDGFMDALVAIASREDIDVCIPLHDASLMLFDGHRELFKSHDVELAINCTETIQLVADKVATSKFFQDIGMPSPPLWTLDAFVKTTERKYPYYVKPRFIDVRGTSQQFFARVDDATDLEYVLHKLAGREGAFVIQEFADGAEINIDFFCDASGNVKSVVALKRQDMGVSRGITRGELITNAQFTGAVRHLTSCARFWGANQLQAFLASDGTILYSEINGRFSGSSIFVRAAGVDYFAALVRLLRGETIVLPEPKQELKMNCWESPFFYDESPIIELP